MRLQVSDLPEWGSQYISIEKHQSVQNLCLSGRGDIALNGEMVQKLCTYGSLRSRG